MITPQTKVLVTGCGGMLGEAVYHYFKDKCQLHPTDSDVNESWLTHLDVTDHSAVRAKVLALKPDYIFHLAGLTDTEYCEQNPLQTYKTNTLATEHIALLCKELNITVVYVSSGGIFDGKQDLYTEYDVPNPLHVYGKSVYAAERSIKHMAQKHFIFRAGWMIGGGPKKDKKFVRNIIHQIQAGTQEISVIDDKVGTPTYTFDIVKVMYEVINKNQYGIYNAVCEGNGSRYDIANEIIMLKKLQNKVKILIADRSQLKKEYFAPRPMPNGLVNLKLKMQGIQILRNWQLCLKEYLSIYDWGI